MLEFLSGMSEKSGQKDSTKVKVGLQCISHSLPGLSLFSAKDDKVTKGTVLFVTSGKGDKKNRPFCHPFVTYSTIRTTPFLQRNIVKKSINNIK